MRFKFRRRPPPPDPRAGREGAFILDVVKRRARLKEELRFETDEERIRRIKQEIAELPFPEE